jgi:hypothetical protein
MPAAGRAAPAAPAGGGLETTTSRASTAFDFCFLLSAVIPRRGRFCRADEGSRFDVIHRLRFSLEGLTPGSILVTMLTTK